VKEIDYKLKAIVRIRIPLKRPVMDPTSMEQTQDEEGDNNQGNIIIFIIYNR
jgi:hypothetical protein